MIQSDLLGIPAASGLVFAQAESITTTRKISPIFSKKSTDNLLFVIGLNSLLKYPSSVSGLSSPTRRVGVVFRKTEIQASLPRFPMV
ncbi:hypothetical protein [Burkholderia glumae]|uniref:hypothetical protein n=1 Tax=Burkholderia glumae TaxID=337 RepID=UPI0019D6C10C|nr:hypothetical protein [Burkholderia glumae]